MNVLQNIKISTIALGLFLFSFNSVHACDLCGCTTSSGSAAFGDLGMSSFIGFRYIHQSYESFNGVFSNALRSREDFNTYQLWGRVPLSKSFFISAVVPYQDLKRNYLNAEHLTGLGDVTTMCWYQLKIYKEHKSKTDKVDFNKVKKETGHTINFGLGLKMPTGEFEERLADRVNPGFQLGTGSWDVITTLVYSYSKNKLGCNATAAYYLKSENKNEYRFGNQFSCNAKGYYTIPTKLASILPFLEISGDVYSSIEQYGETLADTDGSIWNGSIGTEVGFEKFQLGTKFTVPIRQNLFNGTVTSKNRFLLYLNYNL